MVNKRKVKFFEDFEFDTWAQAIGSVVLIIAVLTAVVVATTWLIITNANSKYTYDRTVTYYVESGDTLWTIASRYSDRNNQDIRRVIDIIQEVNNCTANIHPGDALEIPVFDSLGG